MLAALAFAAFAVGTNRVTKTRLGSLNPRSGEVVTDVDFSGIAMTGDVARVEGKVDGMTNTFLRLNGGGAVYGNVSIYRPGRGGIPLSISTWDSDGDPYSLYFSIVNDKWQIIHEAIGVDVAEPYRITLPEASGTMALDSDVAKAARDSTNYTDSAVANYLPLSGGTLSGGITVWGNSTFYGNVFSFSDTFKIKFMDAIATPYFEIFGSDVYLPLGGGTVALTSDIPASMAWDAITGKPTTLFGYGITDALKSDFTSLTNNAAFTSAVAAVSPPTDLTHVEAEIETNRTAIATLSARAYIEVVSADEVYYVFTTNQE